MDWLKFIGVKTLQRKQNFVPDQRWDLIYYDNMLTYIEEEFFAYNELFLSPNNFIIDNWFIEIDGGLTVRVNQSTDSLLMSSARIDHHGINRYKTTDDALTITCADNATNYIEVQLYEDSCAPDIVALWDPLANGNVGQEFGQSADTIKKQFVRLVNNTVSFSGDDDKLPLSIVTTAGGVINNISDERELFFHLDADYNFGGPRTDKGIGNFKEAYDAITTSIKEMKGSPNWYDLPGPTPYETLERLNFILTEGGTISWEAPTADELKWTANLKIIAPSRAYTYTVLAQTITNFLDGEVIYVTMPTFGTVPAGPLTVNKIAASSFTLAQENFILAYRSAEAGSDRVYFGNGWQSVELESGETNWLGDGITDGHLTACGLIDENDSTPPYTTNYNYPSGASFTTAISELDENVELHNQYYHFVVGNPGDVTTHKATHSSLQAAVNAAIDGQRILVLNGYSVVEAVTIAGKSIIIHGHGIQSYIQGTLTLTSSLNCVRDVRFVGNIIINSNGNFINGWQSDSPTTYDITDNGTGNDISVYQWE